VYASLSSLAPTSAESRYEATPTGRYYVVRTTSGEAVLFLRGKRKTPVELRFATDERAAPSLVVRSFDDVLREAPRPSSPPVPLASSSSGPRHVVPPVAELEYRSDARGTVSYSPLTGTVREISHGFGVSELVPTPQGPYTLDPETFAPPLERPGEESLATRLDASASALREGLTTDIHPQIWRDVAATSAQIPKRPRRRTSESAPMATTPGQVFLETFKELPIGASQSLPTIRRVVAGDPVVPPGWAETPPRTHGLAGYVLNSPAHISTSPGGILAQYGEQATAGAVDGVRRIGAVLAVNAVEQLDGGTPVEDLIAQTKPKLPFPYALVGFYWAPTFRHVGVGYVDFPVVRAAYQRLDGTAQAVVRKGLFTFDQDHLPYGLFREQASINAANATMIGLLAKRCAPVYVHVGDPDTIDWRVNNSTTGVLARYDEVLGGFGERSEGPYPPLVIGGYNFGAPSDDDHPVDRLVKLGGIVDRTIRRSIAPHVPESLFPTEPNFLLKAFDAREPRERAFFLEFIANAVGATGDSGALFGRKDAEGQALRTKLARTLERSPSEPSFAPYVDATIETEIPPRIRESATTGSIVGHTQSYTDTSNWTGISRTDRDQSRAKTRVDQTIKETIGALIAKYASTTK
jgi:hypothetical protein